MVSDYKDSFISSMAEKNRHLFFELSHVNFLSATHPPCPRPAPLDATSCHGVKTLRSVRYPDLSSPRTKGQKRAEGWQLKAVDHTQGDVKRQIASVVKPIFSMYRFQTLGEFRALLTLYNTGVEEVRGTRNGQPYRGLLYTALDNSGLKAEVTPIKSSLLGRSCGYDALEKQMERSTEKIAGDGSRDQVRRRVADAFASTPDWNELRERLRASYIDLYIRRNAGERITGATFIDHETRTVLNGSRLGKEYSANALQERFGAELENGTGTHGDMQYRTQSRIPSREVPQPTLPTPTILPVPATTETRQVRPSQRRVIPTKKKPKMRW
jgi:hypothetical protein